MDIKRNIIKPEQAQQSQSSGYFQKVEEWEEFTAELSDVDLAAVVGGSIGGGSGSSTSTTTTTTKTTTR